MNIYFLVEGKRTEMKVYPEWLSYLVPKLQRVPYFDAVSQNTYYIFSGNGYPSLLDNHLRKSVEDINNVGIYDYLVICLDADEQSVQECKQEILEFMAHEGIVLHSRTQLEIIVQNICLETWFLANPKIFKKNPSNEFVRTCVKFYNVKQDDPELMDKPLDFSGTTASFHFQYLKELLAEKNISYSKNNPQGVVEKYYVQELLQRNKQTGHIRSFQYFMEFCEHIRQYTDAITTPNLS